MIWKLVIFGIWMVLVPWGIGYFALGLFQTNALKNGIDKENAVGGGFAFCLGYVLMWAVFQLIAVPVIIKIGQFWQIVLIFELICLTFSIGGFLLYCLHLKYGLKTVLVSGGKEFWKTGKRKAKIVPLFLWAVFLAGLLFQVIQAYRLAYADGDDAFYIPISIVAQSERLYTNIPYTGETTEINLRYALAPFPIWVAFIASKCGVNVAVAAHSMIPLVLIPLTYVLYLEIGKHLCMDMVSETGGGSLVERGVYLPLFMIFVTLLQMFGNYSIYPASTFLLTRTRQGKAALGNVILPFFILILYKMAKEIKEQGKADAQNVLWLMAAMTAGCLCSTMAGFLCSMLVMLTVFLLFILYRKPSVLLQGFLGCIPGIAYALLYLKF